MSATLFEVPVSPLLPLSVKFTVYGRPVPQGSAKAFYVKSLGRAVVTSDNKNLKPWRQQLSDTANALNTPLVPQENPVAITLDFWFERPKGAPKRRRGMTVKPDIDKLVRAVFDAMTGTLIEDDAQIVDVHARKHYGIPERVEIQIGEL